MVTIHNCMTRRIMVHCTKSKPSPENYFYPLWIMVLTGGTLGLIRHRPDDSLPFVTFNRGILPPWQEQYSA